MLDVIKGADPKNNGKFSFEIYKDFDQLHWSTSMLLRRHNQGIH